MTGSRQSATFRGRRRKRRTTPRGWSWRPASRQLGQSEYNVLVDNRAASKITQGITTEITGEGQSIAPMNARMIADMKDVSARYGVTPDWTTLAGYWKAFERARPAINLGTFVGAGGVRDLVIGKDDRPATPAELAAMEAAVARAMEEGAFGLSTSLAYVPDRFASTDEIIALAKVAARYGGTYITHQAPRGMGSMRAWTRVPHRARGEDPVQIYHLKDCGEAQLGAHAAGALRDLEKAGRRARRLRGHLPVGRQLEQPGRQPAARVREGGRDKLLRADMQDPATRHRPRGLPEENPDGATSGIANSDHGVLNQP